MYVSPSQIVETGYDQGYRFVLAYNQEYYTGFYHKDIFGRYWTGQEHTNASILLKDILPNPPANSDEPNTIIKNTVFTQAFTNRYNIDLSAPLISGDLINPTEEDYNKGYFIRYITKLKTSEYPYIVELNSSNYINFSRNKQTVIYYDFISLPWMLVGVENDIYNDNIKILSGVVDTNLRSIQQASLVIPELESYFSDLIQFAKIISYNNIIEKGNPTYTAPLNASDPGAYVRVVDNAPTLVILSTPSISATPSVSLTPSISISETPSVTPSISVSETPSVTPSISVSATPSISATPSVSVGTTPSVSISNTPSISITPSISETPSLSVTPSISSTPGVTQTPSISISATPSISVTPSISISNTPSVTPTISVTPSISISNTPSVTPTISISATPSISISSTPSISITPTLSVTPTPSPIPATINWSLNEYSDPSTFIDANFEVTRVSDGAVYIDQLVGGSGTFTVPAGTTLRLRVYSFTNNPPSYWHTWISATMRGYIVYNAGIIVDGSTTLYPNSGLIEFNSSPNFTVAAGGTYDINVSTYSPVPPSPTPTPTPSVTPSPTPSPTPSLTPSPSSAPPTFTITWSNNFIVTGTNNLQIYKNGDIIVDQHGMGTNSFTVTSSDVITYYLFSTTPDFTEVQIVDSVHGAIYNCGSNSSSVSQLSGVSYTSSATIDGITTNYIDACPS